MRFFDLHCDTLYRSIKENKNLLQNDFHISITKGCEFNTWVECFAVWIPDDLTDREASDFFDDAVKKFQQELDFNHNYIEQVKNRKDLLKLNKNKKCKAILALEGSKVINGDLNRIKYLKDCGVKYITLTWNGDCDIGSGCEVKNPKGLSSFGKDAIMLMNDYGIIPDVSHASDKLFYDVASFSRKPIIATHSNSRTICNHRRNLTDEQFKIIKSMGGIVGINFCRDFLKENGNADFSDIKRHIDYFFSLSGEKTLCIGSDFDGTDMPKGINGIESIELLYDYLLDDGYDKFLLDDLFFNNAYNFFINY